MRKKHDYKESFSEKNIIIGTIFIMIFIPFSTFFFEIFVMAEVPFKEEDHLAVYINHGPNFF